MIRTVLAVAVVALGTTALMAQNDPISARKAVMKANGDQNKVATEMIEGKRPFDLAAAKKVLATWQESGKVKDLFPENSKNGDTAALPAVWENKTDFDAKLAKLVNDSKAAEAAVTNLDTFKTQITEVRKDCGSCHQNYRKRPS
ncbi:MAG: c-type cytochrome [Xanthobacteraceae bacterium]